MLKDDVIYNLSFRFKDINLNNVNNIYFAIDIIVVIITTFFKVFIVDVFVFEFDIVIVVDFDIVIIIVVFEKFIIKFIAFDFDIKKRFIMSVSFDKF